MVSLTYQNFTFTTTNYSFFSILEIRIIKILVKNWKILKSQNCMSFKISNLTTVSEASEFCKKNYTLSPNSPLNIKPCCELFDQALPWGIDTGFFNNVPHSGAEENTVNMYLAQWAALICFAALLTVGLIQVWAQIVYV